MNRFKQNAFGIFHWSCFLSSKFRWTHHRNKSGSKGKSSLLFSQIPSSSKTLFQIHNEIKRVVRWDLDRESAQRCEEARLEPRSHRVLRMSSALDIVNSPPASMFATFTTRSSTTMANLLDRVPSPFSERSSSRPRACVQEAEPSARNFTSLLSGYVFAQAFITKGSFTANWIKNSKLGTRKTYTHLETRSTQSTPFCLLSISESLFPLSS